ncbi:hypothetical protein ILUMI_25464, partial [Ignelater luminosus]
MASNNVFIFSIFLVTLVLLTTVHTKRTNRLQLRPTRGFQEMSIAVSRGFGKRAVDMHIMNKPKSPPDIEWVGRQQRGFQEMDLPVARGFGKRAADMHVIKDFLLEWFALEAKLRNLRERNGLPPLNE